MKTGSKLTQLVKSNAIIRIKKRLYVFGDLFIRGNYSLEMLANLAYGPSYVSLEWALRKYALIPEDVMEVTSVTCKRNHRFISPLGSFSYSHIHRLAYATGITRFKEAPYQGFLIAKAEKALTDFLMIRRGKVTSINEMEMILFEDMRIIEEDLFKLDLNLIKQIYENYPHSAVYYLIKVIERKKNE